MSELSDLFKRKRIARNWSLRDMGGKVGVTPAYIADIEADRRFPGDDLRNRMILVLEIAEDELPANDLRLTADLREWIEKRPPLIGLLQSLKTSSESDMVVQRLSRIFGRRSQPKAAQGFFVTWESELRAIAAEASAWSIETGGDLFGRWNDVPTVLLATKAGPGAQRDHAHFRLDVEYLRHLSETMANEWALRYFGDWHSHHRLGLSSPSGGDKRRILSIAGRNQFTNMLEIIVTLDESRSDPIIRIHPWIYNLSGGDNEPRPLRVKVLPGLSPIRQALMAQKSLGEQDLFAWEKVSLQRIRIGNDAAPPVLEVASDVDSVTREKTLSQLVDALQRESGDAIEQHSTGFGNILVARLADQKYLAFALGTAWPMTVLDVHRMDRDTGSTESTKMPDGLMAPDIPGILAVYRAAKAGLKGTLHVDG
jgi:transcriptional regulator with XRE-family HTH domain